MFNCIKTSSTTKFGRIFAAYILLTGLGFLISEDYYTKLVNTSNLNPVLVNLSGMTHFFIGITALVFHFTFAGYRQVIVSILALLFLVKGSLIIVIPNVMLELNNGTANMTSEIAFGFIFVGLYLHYLFYLLPGTPDDTKVDRR